MLSTQRIQSHRTSRPISRKIRQKLAQFHVEALENRQLLSTTYYVSPTGSDTAAGTSAAPFKTIQQGYSILQPGDTLDVRAGSYAGFCAWDPGGLYGHISGTANAQITIQADPSAAPGSVIINGATHYTPDGIDLEPGCNYITIKGFTVNCNSAMSRAGIRIAQSTGMQIINCTVTNAGTFGITTSFTTNCLIQGCTITNTQGSGEAGHGIYVANSAVNPSVIDNTIYNNGGEGLHMNGDGSQGLPGVISGAVVEGNIIYNNGENGINSDGLVNSIIANNLVYNNARQGIVLYRISAASNATNDIIMNNTVYQPNSSGAALQLVDGSTYMTVFNNILIGGSYGSINIDAISKLGFVSDYNVVTNTFMNNDTSLTMPFATWKSTYGQDAHSTIVAANQLFVNLSGGNYQLISNSPAIDAGIGTLNGHAAPNVDILGNSRPSGNGFDIGAYEFNSAPDVTPPVISQIASGNLTSLGAKITWTTNELSTSVIQYGTTTSYGSSTTLDSSLVTSHSESITGLTANTVYHYRVVSTDASGNVATSADFTFTTPAPDVTPPVVTNITSSNLTVAGATVTWTTNEVADSQVQYGTTTSYGSSTTLNSSLVTSHSVAITGLTPGTTYHYCILTHDASGNLTTSGDFTFTTTALGTGPFTIFSNSTVPHTTDDADAAATVVGVKFQSDLAGYITGVRFYKGTSNTGTHIGYLWTDSGTLLASATFTGESASGWQTVTFSTPVPISANTTYVAGYYAPKGQYAEDDDVFDTSGIDSPPLHALASGVDGVDGVYNYGGPGTFPTSTYLNANYYVDVVFNTTANDTTPPTISAVTSSGLTTTGSTVTWTTNEAADSQVQYGTTTSYGSTTTLNATLGTSHSVALSGLTSGTLYHYRVLSHDAAGNLTTSADFTFTTAVADTTAPTASLAVANITSSGGSTYTFTVTFSDNVAVNVSSLGSTDVQVTGPNSFSQTATFVSVNTNSNGTPRTATYRINTPGGAWDLTDNGTYTVAMLASQVADTSGNFVAAGNLGTFSVNISDTTAPTATLSAPNVTTATSSTYTFTVTYSDNVAVNVSTIGSTDVTVTGPNSFSQSATLVSVNNNANGTPRTATYRITAPNGSWDTTDNGTYTIAMLASQVADTSGNFVAAGNLGTFTATLPDTALPTASLSASNVTTTGSTYTFTVTYSDNVGINVSTLDSNDVVVTGPNGFSQAASFVSVDTNANGTPRTATYRITAPGSGWDETDNGTYTVAMFANQVSDTTGHFVAAGALGTFFVNDPDMSAPTAELNAQNINSGGSSTYTFSVTYSDDVAVDVASLGSTNLGVIGPNGYSQIASLVSIDADTNGPTRTAVYKITSPDSSWNVADNGLYTIAMLPNQVADTGNNFMAAGALGSFSVAVVNAAAPTASLTASNVTTPASTYTFTVTYNDDVAVNVTTLGSNNVIVTGPNGFSQAATFVSVNNNSNGATRTAIYRITAPNSGWDLPDEGTYTISMQANQVVDTSGSFVAAGALGTFTVELSPSQNTADPATHLVFYQHFTTTIAGQQMSTVTVYVKDASGNTVTTDNSGVTIAIARGPAGAAALQGTLTVQANGGVAVFNDLVLDTSGSYTFMATDGGLTLGRSVAFAIKADASSATLQLLQQPATAIIGKLMTPALAYEVVDQFGNLVTSDHSKVTLSVASGPGTLVGPVTALVSGGVARFGYTRLSAIGDYSIQATDSNGGTANPDAIITVAPGVTSIAAPVVAKKGYAFGKSITLFGLLKSTASTMVHFSGTATITDQDNNVIGTATVGATGALKFVLTNVAPGTYTCTINYPGDANHTAVTSATFALTVNPAPAAAHLTAGASPFLASAGFALTTSVSTSGDDTPATGTVTFLDNGAVIGVVNVNPNSTASLTITHPALGRHSYSAIYSGDPNLTLCTTATANFTIVDDDSRGAGAGPGSDQRLRLIHG